MPFTLPDEARLILECNPFLDSIQSQFQSLRGNATVDRILSWTTITSIDQIREINLARNLLIDQSIQTLDDLVLDGREYAVMPESLSAFHRVLHSGNVKWQSADGHQEFVFRQTSQSWTLVRDAVDLGTYNFAGAGPSHIILDVIPWILFGASAGDTTTVEDRRARFVASVPDAVGDFNLWERLPDWIADRIGRETPQLSGDENSNTLTAGAGRTQVFGYGGNDVLDGGAGADSLYGGAGIDLATYFGSNAGVVIDLGRQRGFLADAASDSLPERLFQIEDVQGTIHADVLIGDGVANTFFGESGYDALHGAGGNDSLYGGGGFDRLYGDANEDLLKGEAGDDQLFGGAGDDDLYGDENADRLNGDLGADSLHGGSGGDVFVFTDGDIPAFQRFIPDRITDYNRGTGSYFRAEGDLIDLSGIAFASGAGSASTVRLRSVAASGGLPEGAVLEVLTGDVAAGNWLAIARLDGVAAGEAVRIALTEAQSAGRTGSTFVVDAVGNGTTWSVSPATRNVAEGEVTISFTITRSGTTLGPQTVYVSTSQTHGYYNDGDYVGRLNVPVIFAANDTSETFTVRINADALPEGDETFDVIVQSDRNDPASVHLAIASFTLQDGAPPVVSGSNYTGDDLANIWSGTSSNDIGLGMGGNDSLIGSGGDDILAGGYGDDTLFGGSGNDVILSGNGSEYIDAGSGNDIVDARSTEFAAGTVLGGVGDDTILAGSGPNGPPRDLWILNVDGGGGIDTLIVEAGTKALEHQFGAGALLTASSDYSDVLAAVTDGGVHHMYTDRYTTIMGSTSQAWVYAQNIERYEYRGGVGNDLFVSWANNLAAAYGGEGVDTLFADWSTTTAAIVWNTTVNNDIQRNLGNGVVVQSIERLMLRTGSGNDNLIMGDQEDHVETGAGEDRLNGGGGNDALIGGAGNDMLTGGSGADSLDGGRGSDVLNYGRSTSGVSVDLSLNTVSGGDAAGDSIAGFENAFGGSGDDILSGAGGTNLLNGNNGNDTLGGSGGDDTLNGGTGNDTVTGGTGADSLNGGGGADTLDGGAGADTLIGGLGKDSMIGGSGNDIFIFETAPAPATADRISDFRVRDDTIRLDDAVFLGLDTGTLAANAFAANPSGQAMSASERIIYETDTGLLYFDSDGAGGVARVQFATVTAGLALTSADFFVF